jgi:hypothetical protein
MGYITQSRRVYVFCLPFKDVQEVEAHVERLNWFCALTEFPNTSQIAPGMKLLVVGRKPSEVDAFRREGGELAATGYGLRHVGAGVAIGMLSAFASLSAA